MIKLIIKKICTSYTSIYCHVIQTLNVNLILKTKAVRDTLDMKIVLTDKASSLVWEDNTVFKCLSKCVLCGKISGSTVV